METFKQFKQDVTAPKYEIVEGINEKRKRFRKYVTSMLIAFLPVFCIYKITEIIESIHLAVALKRRSKNSGIV